MLVFSIVNFIFDITDASCVRVCCSRYCPQGPKMLRFLLVLVFLSDNYISTAAKTSIRINIGNAKIGGSVRINNIQKGFASATVKADKAKVKGSTTVTKIKAETVCDYI